MEIGEQEETAKDNGSADEDRRLPESAARMKRVKGGERSGPKEQPRVTGDQGECGENRFAR